MNTNLILKSSGKEFVIINELVKEIKYSYGAYISKSSPLIYQNGDNSISVYTDNEYGVFLDDKINNILKIVDISETKNETELDISVGIVRLYNTYEFSVLLVGGNKYKIKGKYKIKESKPMKDVGLDYIREIYEKIESINLIDHNVFKSDQYSFSDYRFTILDDSIGVTNLNNFKPIIKRFTDVINDLYKGGYD